MVNYTKIMYIITMKTQINSIPIKELLLPVNFSKFTKFLRKNSQAVLNEEVLENVKKCSWLKLSIIESIIQNNEYRQNASKELETISSSPVLSTDLEVRSLPKSTYVRVYGLLTGM